MDLYSHYTTDPAKKQQLFLPPSENSRQNCKKIRKIRHTAVDIPKKM